MQCEFCSQVFATKGNLKNHQLTTKYCLELRNSKNEKWKCEYCQKNYSSKQSLEQHFGKCIIKNQQNKELEFLKNKINLKETELQMKENFYLSHINELKDELIMKEKIYLNQIKELQDKLKKNQIY